jgi:two-component system sensor histidine kinase SenX3
MVTAQGRRGAIAFFVTLGVCLVALAVALNVGWIVLNWREMVPLLLGVPVFAAIITGLILNTTFLVREIRRNAQHDAFVNAVTHELKTPVTSIRLHLETLKAREQSISPEKRQEFYDVMLEDSARLMHTIEQVLRTGQAGQTPLHPVPVDLRALADRCVERTRSRQHLPDEAVRSAAHARSGPVIVLGDEDDLEGAVMNLLDNAVKYSGERVDVEVDVRDEGGEAVLTVRDRGVGFPATENRRIFKRFYRVPGSLTQRVKGTGLGLFIVQTTAKRHGGSAEADSDGPGRGATFRLRLPLAPHPEID